MSEKRKQKKMQNRANRRSFLATVGASAAGFAFVGNATATKGQKVDSEQVFGSASREIELSQKNAMSNRDIRNAQQRIAKRYGQSAAHNLFPDRSEEMVGTESITTQTTRDNTTRVDSWEQHYAVKSDQTGETLANTDHFLNLYKANNTDVNGNVVYFFESLNYSDDSDSFWYDASTRYMSNYVNLTSSKDDLQRIRPNQRIDVGGGGSRTIGLSAAGATVSRTFAANGGHIAPDGDRLHFGPSGEFAVELNGKVHGTATMASIMDVRSTTGYWSRNWSTHVNASTTA